MVSFCFASSPGPKTWSRRPSWTTTSWRTWSCRRFKRSWTACTLWSMERTAASLRKAMWARWSTSWKVSAQTYREMKRVNFGWTDVQDSVLWNSPISLNVMLFYEVIFSFSFSFSRVEVLYSRFWIFWKGASTWYSVRALLTRTTFHEAWRWWDLRKCIFASQFLTTDSATKGSESPRQWQLI